jgi:hypothetical protein
MGMNKIEFALRNDDKYSHGKFEIELPEKIGTNEWAADLFNLDKFNAIGITN